MNRIFPEDLPGLSGRAEMLFRLMLMGDWEVQSVLDGPRLTYSMWQGYLKVERSRKARKWMEASSIPLESIHTSGHASVADL